MASKYRKVYQYGLTSMQILFCYMLNDDDAVYDNVNKHGLSCFLQVYVNFNATKYLAVDSGK